jgi:cytochrome P450
MRIRPVAPIVVILEAKVETVVGDLLVPKETRVAVLMRPAACHPDHFGEPQSFRPEGMAGRVRDYPGITLADPSAWPDFETALKAWRKSPHDMGIRL